MAQRGSNNKVANSLVAMSSAAVLAVYAAGYAKTESAAKLLEARTAERRPAPPQTRPARAAVPEPPAAVPLPAVSFAKPDPPREPRLVASAEPSIPPAAPAPEAAPAPVASPSPEPVAEPTAAPVTVPVPEPPPAPAPPATPAAHVWKDGTYTGWGTSRHGDIQATVVIESGRIASAKIAQCLTRYSCDVIDKLPPQVAQRQSPEVDYVSGATQSTNAFYYAVVEALDKAK